MPTGDSDFKFNSSRLGNSRSRPGFMRLGARTQPVDFIDFFTIQDTDQAFAVTVQRVKDILTGQIAKRITLAGGLGLARHASNTVPVVVRQGFIEVVPPYFLTLVLKGKAIFVQATDPALVPANKVMPGDVWVK